MEDPRYDVHEVALGHHPTIKGVCCQEWDLALGYRPGRCGLCGKVPEIIGPVRD